MARVTTALWMVGLLVIAGASAASGESSTPEPAGPPRVIELEATATLQFYQDGAWVRDIPVVPGETVLFRLENTAGFPHNFYIGTEEELAVPSATTEIGIPEWDLGVREVTWTVPEDISGLRWACTVPGHYVTEHGTFSLAATRSDGSVETARPVPVMVSRRVEVPWAGVAVSFPEDWFVDVGDGPSEYGDVLFASAPDWTDGQCQLRISDATGYDLLAAGADSDELLSIDDASAIRFDLVLPSDATGTVYQSNYVMVSSDMAYELTCWGNRTPDHWLSIAETFQLLPAE